MFVTSLEFVHHNYSLGNRSGIIFVIRMCDGKKHRLPHEPGHDEFDAHKIEKAILAAMETRK